MGKMESKWENKIGNQKKKENEERKYYWEII